MPLDDLGRDERATVVRHLHISWHSAVACVSKEWRAAAYDDKGPWRRLQSGDVTNLAEAVFVKRAASRIALDTMWSSAKVLRTDTKEASVSGGLGLPGLKDVLAAQISLLAFQEAGPLIPSVVITPCAAAAIAEACEWAVSWYHVLFDACRVDPMLRSARRLATIFDVVHSSRCNNGTLPSAMSGLGGYHGIMQRAKMTDLLGPISDGIQLANPHDATDDAQRPFLLSEGTADGNWLLACCFLMQFCPSLVDNCFEDNELLMDGTSQMSYGTRPRTHSWSDGTHKKFLFIRGEAVLRTLQSCPCSRVTLPWTTRAVTMDYCPQDVFGWTQFGEFAAQSIHAYLVRNQPTLLRLARCQLTPFLDEDELPASSESTSAMPLVSGSQTHYWKIVNAYMVHLKARQWLLESCKACGLIHNVEVDVQGGTLPASADEVMADEAMSESAETASSIDDDLSEDEADDLYRGFQQGCCGESIDAPAAEEGGEDEEEGEEQYDADDPEYIPWFEVWEGEEEGEA